MVDTPLNTSESPSVLDWHGLGLSAIQLPEHAHDVRRLKLDYNKLESCEGLGRATAVEQLSINYNHLTSLRGIHTLVTIRHLDVRNNRLTNLRGIEALEQLDWLDASGNRLASVGSLEANVMLRYLDFSDNHIVDLPNLSMLFRLKTLFLRKNNIRRLLSVPRVLPSSLTTLVISDNDIDDLHEASFLSFLTSLERLSLAGNPCLEMAEHTGTKTFNYRPYVVCCCPTLRELDDQAVTLQDRSEARALFSGAESFGSGQHSQLVAYLNKQCSRGSEPVEQLKVLVESVEDDESGDMRVEHDTEEREVRMTYERAMELEMMMEAPVSPPPPQSSSIVKDSSSHVSTNSSSSPTRAVGARVGVRRSLEAALATADQDSLPASSSSALSPLRHHAHESVHHHTQHKTSSSLSSSSSASIHILRHRAALRIQTLWRGFRARQRWKTFLRYWNACVRIQSAWRGYAARAFDPAVIQVRHEIRARRLEAYVRVLSSQVSRLGWSLAEESQRRRTLEETVQRLVEAQASLATAAQS